MVSWFVYWTRANWCIATVGDKTNLIMFCQKRIKIKYDGRILIQRIVLFFLLIKRNNRFCSESDSHWSLHDDASDCHNKAISLQTRIKQGRKGKINAHFFWNARPLCSVCHHPRINLLVFIQGSHKHLKILRKIVAWIVQRVAGHRVQFWVSLLIERNNQ